MTKQTKQKNVFDDFIGKYALSKTLRFELRPVGKTRECMNENLQYDEKLQTFLKDQIIEDSYQKLKPIFDKIHEDFITQSLESEKAKQIDFSVFLEKYKNRKDIKQKEIEEIEKELREKFVELYKEPVDKFKKDAGKDNKGKKDVLEKNNFEILTEKGILIYIERNIDKYADITKNEILEALGNFRGFFTYFTGFNKNRENYYETKKEASTAVATRIVNENLPKFCDNLIAFKKEKEEYLGIYDFLKNNNKVLQDNEGNTLLHIEENIFDISCFGEYLSQGKIENYNKQISNANFLINLYNQEKNKENNFKKLTLFKTLDKQIGCGKRDDLFFSLKFFKKSEKEKDIKDIQSVEEVLELAKKAGDKYFIEKTKNVEIKTIGDFIEYILNKENYLGVYWSQVALNTISSKYFSNWHTLKEKLKDEKIFRVGKGEDEEDIKIPEAIELGGFFDVLNETENWQDKAVLFKDGIFDDESKEYFKNIILKSKSPSQALLLIIFADLKKHADSFIEKSKEILNLNNYSNEKDKDNIKKWLDDAIAVSRILKYFSVKESKIKGDPIDPIISEGLNVLLRSDDATWFKWYDAVRNFLTKKPQDDVKDNKLKLNFDNSALAAGWDINKESDNFCVILRNKNNEKFLAITSKENKNIFEKEIKIGNGKKSIIEKNSLYISDSSGWEKMEYKFLPSPNKMLPKCLIPKKDRKKYGSDDEILSIYDNGGFKKNENTFSINNLHKIIEFYKSGISKYKNWDCFNFKFKNTNDYEDISQFYSDVEKQGYKIDFIRINRQELYKLVENGKIYLFAIRNQDNNINKIKDHKNNLHTIYWDAVFENIENRPKLNGKAELFYRKALLDNKLEKIEKGGKKIIKNFRFSKEKFLFHIPITLNFCSKNEKINLIVNNAFIKNENVNFLGIDRGEKHLAYYSLIDKNGNIIEQDTLNMLFLDKYGNERIIKVEKKIFDKDGKEKTESVDCKDYNDLLDARAGNRDYARKNWQTIGTIKELKDGYISQVIRKITDLSIKNQAFIVLENLNKGFKRGRQKIEKSVYQKLELALAKKLNFVVDKKAKIGEIGSVTNALQLTPPVNNFGDMENRKQFGIMLYTKADYTSQTDPLTGWRKKIYLKKGSEDSIKKQIKDSFDKIGFDGKDYYFEYTVDYLDPVNKKSDKKYQKKWRLYSSKNGKDLDRFFRENLGKEKWSTEKQKIIETFDKLFENFKKDDTILEQIKSDVSLTKVNKRTAWETLRFTINLIQQIRNTGINKNDEDFILSPVRDNNGNHFDSRILDKSLPISGDANGAYNIAKKGIIMAEHIKKDFSLFIRDDEWDALLAGKEIWNEWIEKNKNNLQKLKS